MKKLRIALTAAAVALSIGGAFAVNSNHTAKVDSSDWFALDPNSGALISPATVIDLSECSTGAHYCAGKYTTNSQGQPVGQRLDVEMKP